MRTAPLKNILILSSLFVFSTLVAQSGTEILRFDGQKSITAGENFHAGFIKQWLLGKHYRQEWLTAINAPVLNLQTSGGGLRPHKRSGGFQSKSLSFVAADGSKFQFRSIDKDPSRILPEELRDTFITGIVRDQNSSAHPYGPAIVPVLAKAAGILHTNPKVVVLPDVPALGEFQTDFGGIVGFIEEFAANGDNNSPGFGGFSHILGTPELLELLENDFGQSVDQKNYLTARLLDIFISDWDRHFDQWRWAKISGGSPGVWQPIPIDRDQAFVKFDGLLPSFAERRTVVPQLEGINKKKTDYWSITFQARHTDRLFLNALTAADFTETAVDFVAAMTDSVIESAVQQVPQEIFQISGPALIETLKKRRKMIPEAAAYFYKNLAKTPEITGHDLPEILEIDRSKSGEVSVKISPANSTETSVYERTFFPGETREIRIFLFGGDDQIITSGDAEKRIRVRVIGGSGADIVQNDAPGNLQIYDLAGNTTISGTHSPNFISGKIDSVINWHEYQPKTLSRGQMGEFFPQIAYNADDGFILGMGHKREFYSFRRAPYAAKLRLNGSFATETSAVRFGGNLEIPQAFSGFSTVLDLGYYPKDVSNFYGLGNSAKPDKSLERNDFYKLQSNQYWAKANLLRRLSSRSVVYFGATLQHFDTSIPTGERLISQTKPYGLDVSTIAKFSTGITGDFRDLSYSPSNGWYANISAEAAPKTLDNDSAFVRGMLDLRGYFSPFSRITLAFRAYGQKIWGGYPYYEAAFLGGPTSLRGFLFQRYGGDSALLGNSELRFKIVRGSFLIPVDFGILGFTDIGHVWIENESSENWHNSVGGGIWLIPAVGEMAFSLVAANSDEGLRFHLISGFSF
ncbi:MAG: BamA/TamA family outer membrane protein [Calditrichae bacterium]|nr:BamA/TamA family outer membrane protein [Calditrichia bacterium]